MTPERIKELEQQVRKEHALLAAYPHVREAVSWVEVMLCIPPDDEPDESAWDMMVAANVPPDEIVVMVRQAIHEEQEEGFAKRDGYANAMKLAYAQTFHPEFTSYIAGKLGMM